jgi:hypothetical protein
VSYRTLTDANGLLLAGFARGQHPFLSALLLRTGHVEERPVQIVNAVSPRNTKRKLSPLPKRSRLHSHYDESSSELKGLAARSLPRRETRPRKTPAAFTTSVSGPPKFQNQCGR